MQLKRTQYLIGCFFLNAYHRMPFSEKFFECVLAVDFGFIETLPDPRIFSPGKNGGPLSNLFARGLQPELRIASDRHLVLLTQEAESVEKSDGALFGNAHPQTVPVCLLLNFIAFAPEARL